MRQRNALRRSSLYWPVLGILFTLGMLLPPRPAQAQALLPAQRQILSLALTQSTNVWKKLGFSTTLTFDSSSVDIAYLKLTQLRTLSDSVELYSKPGPFLHLVKQAVMLNAVRFPVALTRPRLAQALYVGYDTATVSTQLAALREKNGAYLPLPHDPNGMSGPVARMAYTQPPSKTYAAARYYAPAATTPPLEALPPLLYTIYFENEARVSAQVGAATQVEIVVEINPRIQQFVTFTLTELTWNSGRAYPVGVAQVVNGLETPLAPGTAVVPGEGQTLTIRFSNNMRMSLLRQTTASRIRFTMKLSGVRLDPRQNGSISFAIEPFGLPNEKNIKNDGATITFRNSAGSAAAIPTNPWPRPGTVF